MAPEKHSCTTLPEVDFLDRAAALQRESTAGMTASLPGTPPDEEKLLLPVLAEKAEGLKPDGKSTATMADQVLVAVARLHRPAGREGPGEVANCRSVIDLAVSAAPKTREGGSPAVKAMADKISEALADA